MAWRNKRLFGAAAVIAAAFGVSTPAAHAQSAWQANDDDFLLLQFTLGKYRMDQEVRGYQTDKGVCLDLADVIQSLDLPVRLDKKSRRATGWLFSEDQAFTIDREANTVQNVNTGKAPLSGEIYDTPEGWCVDLKALSRWFGVDMRADLFDSAIRIDETAKLPFIEAIERRSRAARLKPRKAAFDLSKYPRADAEYRLWRTPSVDVNLRASYSGGAGPTRRAVRYDALVAGELGKASYTARIASDNDGIPSTVRFTGYRNDPDGGLLGPLKATQVAIGDVQSETGQLTARSAVGRGAFISNRPLQRSSRYTTTEIRGTLPTGWDAELYRNGQLIAFQSETGNGRYEFLDLPLYFGRNEFEVVLYGPQGQVRRIREDMPVGVSAIEPGKTYYWAGILQEDRDLIELGEPTSPDGGHWRWGVGVERGLNDKTSVALGMQSMFYAGKRRDYLEGNVLRRFGSMQLGLGAAYQLGGGTAVQANAIGRLGSVNLGFDAAWVQGDFSSEFVGGDIRYMAALRADTSLRFGRFSLPVQAGLGRAQLRNGEKVTEWLISTATVLARTQIRAEMKGRMGSGANGDETTLRVLASRRMLGLSIRGAADFNLSGADKGFTRARLTTGRALDDVSEINAEVEYEAATEDTRFALGYTRSFKSFALRGNAEYNTRGSFGLNIALSFSFGPDPANGGIRFSESRLARNGQASVLVYRDDDGNGRRDPGEEALPDVQIAAGMRLSEARTGENGRVMVDDLKPYVPVLVGVDETTLGDPYLAPAVKGYVVVPRPGIATPVEIPVTPSGEVEGLLLSTVGTEQPGVALELVDMRGAVVAETITEFDGFFLFEKVPYGQYRLRVADDAARALQVQASLGSTVAVSREQDIARMGAIKLRQSMPTTIAGKAPAGPAGSAP